MHSSIGIQVVALSVALLSVTLYAEAGNVQLDYSVTDENRSCANPGEQVTFTCMTDGGVLIFIATRFPSDSITFVSSDEVAETVERSVGVSTFTATLTEVDDSVLTATLTVVASEEVTGTVGCTDNVNIQEANLCLTAAPETPRNLEVTLMRRDFLLLSWDPPSNLPSGVETTYNVTVVNPANGMVYPGFPMNNIASTSVEFEELETSCQLYEFNVTAENSAGSSDPAVIRETIPISPDVTSVSVSLMATVSFDRADILLSLTFNRAIACSTRFGVESYNISLNGEIVMEFSDPGSDPVNITLSSSEISALLPDTEYNITVTACSSLTCRQAEPTTAVTTDVQSASVTFVETRVLLSCELAEGSPALGCVFIFTLNSKTERFNVSRSDTMGSQRRRQMDTQAEMCQTTRNLPDVYDSVTVVDWESDGSEGTLSMTVVPQEDPDPDNFVCPDGTADQGSDIGMIVGAVVGIVGAIIAVIGVIVVSVMVIKSHKRKVGQICGKGGNVESKAKARHVPPLPSSRPVELQEIPPEETQEIPPEETQEFPPEETQVGQICGKGGNVESKAKARHVPPLPSSRPVELQETPLHEAARDGSLDTVKLLVDQGTDVNLKDDDGKTPLHYAALHGNHHTVKYLVGKGAGVNIRNDDGETPLHNAADRGNLHTAQHLVDHGAEVNIRDNCGRTPLHNAVLHGNHHTVKYLVGKGAGVNIKDNDGETPLHLAALHRDRTAAVLKYLVDKGADVNIRNNVGRVPLHNAADHGNLEAVKHIVEHGADVNIKDNGGKTPLDKAAAADYHDVVNYLTKHGADVSIKSKQSATKDSASPVPTVVELKPKQRTTTDSASPPTASVELKSEEETAFGPPTSERSTPLHWAACCGNLDKVTYLVDQGADVNLKDNHGKTPLHYAAFHGNLEIVKYLVGHGAGVDIRNDDGETPLHNAAERGNLHTAQHLVGKGAEVNIRDNRGRTPLHNAVLDGNLFLVEYLVDIKVDVNLKDNLGETPLHWAALHGSRTHAAVKYLVDHGADVNIRNNVGRVPLHNAADHGNLEAVKHIVGKGADVNIKDNGGETPLDKAAAANQHDVVKYLTEHGGIKTNGSTPLHWAACCGDLDKVTYLVDQGADVNLKDNHENTPLHYAAFHGYLETVKYLVGHGAGVDIRNDDGETPLHNAADRGNLHTAQHLVGKGAEVNIRDNRGRTPLHNAVLDGNLFLVEYLVDVKVDVNLKDNLGETPLHWAALHGSRTHAAVKYLVDHGADVNIRNNVGRAPLHNAADHGNLEAVKHLVGHKADLNIKDNGGETPLHKAAASDHLDVVKYLVDHGADVKTQTNSGSEETTFGHPTSERPMYNTRASTTIFMEECNEEVCPLSYRDTIPYPGVLFLGDCYHATLTSQTKELKFERIGLSISIPPGTIPEGDVLDIEVLPCLTGPFVLPDDYEPASPAYLIRPRYEFHKPVELTVQHYFDLQTQEDCESMAFLTASSTPTYNSCVNPEYMFSEIEGNKGTFQIGESVGKIALKHFCKVVVATSANADKLYSVRLYKEKSPTTVAIFTISHCHEVYITNLEQIMHESFPDVNFQCSKKVVKLTAESDKVILTIPDIPGWRIISDKIPPEIDRDEIDLPFKDKQYAMSSKSDYPPTIHLDMLSEGFSRPQTVCQLQVTGLSHSFQFSLILHSLHGSQVLQGQAHHLLKSLQGGSRHELAESQTTTTAIEMLKKPSLGDLVEEVKPAVPSLWYRLGLQLGVDDYQLAVIQEDTRGVCEESRKRMLREWMRSCERPSWTSVVTALRTVGEMKLAADLETKFSL